MTDVAGTAPDQARVPGVRPLRRMLAATEIDLRLFGMLVALAAILIGFGIVTGGRMLQPTNLVTLSVQTAVVADHGDRAWSSSSSRATSTCRSARSSASSPWLTRC